MSDSQIQLSLCSLNSCIPYPTIHLAVGQLHLEVLISASAPWETQPQTKSKSTTYESCNDGVNTCSQVCPLVLILKLPGNLFVLSAGNVYTSFSLLSIFSLASGMWWLIRDVIFSGSHVSFLYKLIYERKDSSFVFSLPLPQKQSSYQISSLCVLVYLALGSKQMRK